MKKWLLIPKPAKLAEIAFNGYCYSYNHIDFKLSINFFRTSHPEQDSVSPVKLLQDLTINL